MVPYKFWEWFSTSIKTASGILIGISLNLYMALGRIDILAISFANIVFHLVGCLFILLMVFFAVQKLLEFDYVPFICFYPFFLYIRR